MTKYYMGIDNGGTLCKAVIFNSKGEEISSSSCKLELHTPHSGYTERNMTDLWNSNAKAIRNALDRAEISPEMIRGVACSGHGKGLYLWGKNNTPCYNGIVSTDTRAWEYPVKWEKDGTALKAFEKTFQKILACQPVSLLNWFKDNSPEVIEQIQWIFEVKDYMRFRLTGEAYSERTDYSGSGMMNLKTCDFDRELLKLFDLEDLYEKLPPIRKSTDICGYITREAAEQTGLVQGTPVAGGMFDIDACSIAMDITDEKNICVIAGTWSINEYISKGPVTNHSVMMNSLYCLDGYYLIEECSPTSAGNLEWFVETFLDREKREADILGINIYQYCDKLVNSINPEDHSLYYLPFLFGSNYNPNARSCFIGLDRSHTRADMIRAVFEGIVFCHMVHIEKLLQNREETRAIRLAGGAAKSSVWAQMFADISDLPVETIETEELGALGCAMAASVAEGEYDSLNAAALEMVKIRKKIQPDKSRTEVYSRKYTIYRKISDSLDGLWKGME